MRRAYVLWIGLSVTLAACGAETSSKAPGSIESGADGGKEEVAVDPGPSCGDPNEGCTSGAIGDGACVDIVELKNEASGELCDPGLYLSAFDIDVGGCPDGQALAAKYACCPPPPPTEQPDKPPPDEDPSASNCTVQDLAVDACADVASLEESAADACAIGGATLVDRKSAGDCPDGQATELWFTCCAPASP